jgi:hypothetical protein
MSDPLVLKNFSHPAKTIERKKKPHGITNIPAMRGSLAQSQCKMDHVFIEPSSHKRAWNYLVLKSPVYSTD